MALSDLVFGSSESRQKNIASNFNSSFTQAVSEVLMKESTNLTIQLDSDQAMSFGDITCETVKIGNISQDITTGINANMVVNTDITNQLSADIENKLEQEVTSTADLTTELMNSGGSQTNKTENFNSNMQILKNTVSSDKLSEILIQASQSQTLDFGNISASKLCEITDISQNIVLDVIAEIISNTTTEALNDIMVKNQTRQSLDVQSTFEAKGLGQIAGQAMVMIIVVAIVILAVGGVVVGGYLMIKFGLLSKLKNAVTGIFYSDDEETKD